MQSQASTPSQIFVAQSVDHAVGFLFATLLLFAALTLFGQPPLELLWQAGPVFWWGYLGTLWMCSFTLRALGILHDGATLGQQLMRLDARVQEEPLAKTLLRQFIESAHLALPALWAVDWVVRAQNSRLVSRSGSSPVSQLIGARYTRAHA